MDERPLWGAARLTFLGAMLLFVTTIVIGILNGLDVYTPDHDTLIGHVHAGTLGWITLALSGMAMLAFTKGRSLSAAEVATGRRLAWAITGAITLYVAAFYTGDAITDRIQRPIAGTLLLIVMIWFLFWLFGAQKHVTRTVARLGFLLAFVSMVIGAVFGVILGLATAGKEVPGLSADTAEAVAEAHPPAMVVGFLILAALAMIEWLLGDRDAAGNRSGVVQMWLLFAAGILSIVAFIGDLVDQLLGPANLMMIVGVVMALVRHRASLKPAAWKGAGIGLYARFATLFLLGYLVLLTIIVARFVSGSMDPDAMTPSDEGLIIALDHSMFVGVMTATLFGALAAMRAGTALVLSDKVLLWGVNIGLVGFLIGLITTENIFKQIFTPLMGLALLHGIATYFMAVRKQAA